MSFTIVNAQKNNRTVVLKWNDTYTINTVSSKTITTPLLDNGLFDENYLPIYFEQWKVNNNYVIDTYKIYNVVYQNVNDELFYTKDNSIISSNIISSCEVKKAKNESFAQLSLKPLILKNGQYKKIIKFDLEYSLKPSSNRVSRTFHDSPLSNGNWFKFAIDTTGVFKLDKSFLKSIGISVNSINPKNIQIYGNGGNMLPEANNIFRYNGLQENSIYIKGEEDNSFDTNDFILFYGVGSNSWKHNLDEKIADHQNNIYSDRAYYFIHIGNDLGKRITDKTVVTGLPISDITTYNAFEVHEIDNTNIDNLGQLFFGENFTVNDTQNFSFNFNDIDLTKDINVKLSAATVSDRTTYFKLKYNNQEIISLGVGQVPLYSVGNIANGSTSFTAINDEINFEISYNNSGNPSSKAYLDYIEINGIKKLIARDKQFSFRNYNHINSINIEEFSIENKDNIFQIWDITDTLNPKIIENTSSSNKFTFLSQGGNFEEFILLNNSDYYTPIKLNNSKIENQNLHGIIDVDYLIITKEELLNEANRLANYHKSKGLSTLVLTEQLIYNEFSSGSKDPVAIRDFIKHLYFNASSTEKRIKYVLMFGDTSFDYKDIEKQNKKNINVIAYQSLNSMSLANSYVTDDFFVMLDDNEGDFYTDNGSGDLIDVAIGRMPVKNLDEAEFAVDRTLNYYSEKAFGSWRNIISLTADDVDNKAINFTLAKQMEEIADQIKQIKPVYNIKKIYADAFVQEISSGGQSYPEFNKALNESIERGTLIIDYFGHGGENGWGSERLLDIPQIDNWSNYNTLPLFITITCEFSRYDNPTRIAAGEHVFSNKNGGSVSMITTSREVYIDSGGNFNEDLIGDLLDYNSDEGYTISQALAITKNKNNNSSYEQRLFISYFGDPAMHLAKPRPKIKLTHMNDIDVSQELDTIKALSHVYFKGLITDENDNLLNNFNGNLKVIVYDKEVNRVTLNNDNYTLSNDEPATFVFDIRDSKIFRGNTSVVNGEWEFDFIAPRDIRIAYGNAKLSFYADNKVIDKNGYNTDIIIGGINYDAPEDNIGPKIKLFMNDESFIDGGNTNESPLFLAVLEDESGINTSFSSVDHDIIAILDGNQSEPVIMNDYYETEPNNFKKGKVKFPFKDLSIGLHTLTFKCWDTYNNPSEASISFVVVSDSDLVLDNVLNYPNPFINYTEFWFNHNKPNEPLQAQVQIFTVSGKLIKTINQQILTNGTLSRTMSWNGLDDFGNKIGKGVYIYKLKVNTIENNLKAEKIEKLVILQ